MSNKDFKVTVSVTFKKTYIVNAADWEYAEDQGVDEAFGDVYSIHDPDATVEVEDVETI